jgi:arylsulfatase A-like enzyme
MVMFDSLNRHMLPPYGCDWVHAPNFARLAEKSVTFDSCFVGSMPCMPARRELHTGRYNFLHRSWGPLEPFDDSMPEILKEHDVPTHLTSDHYHYWEEGGCTYHTRYSNWSFHRGQEGDPWKGDIATPDTADPNPGVHGKIGRQDWVNRSYMNDESLMPQAQTMSDGIAFIEKNKDAENWFLQIETFDPHEPYFVPDSYKALYDHDFSSPRDWPQYQPTEGRDNLTEQFRYTNAALVSMCDAQLGRILDAIDRTDLWDDTMLIVNTDHGFLLGEHDWWGKCAMPFYSEIAHTPLFIWDPRARVSGERRSALVQTIDLPATILDFFGRPIPETMQGVPLGEVIRSEAAVREAGLFGMHGGHVNVTDGRYVYMRAPAHTANGPLYNYTHMPTHMRHTFTVEEMRTATMAPPFSFTRQCPVMKIDSLKGIRANSHSFGDLLFDNLEDPKQEHPIDTPAIVDRMTGLLVNEMRKNDAPAEQFVRLGLES